MTTPTITASGIAECLSCGKQGCPCQKCTGNNLTTHCPAHDDAKPSLSLKEEGGKILWHCKGGCSQESVMNALKARGLLSNISPNTTHGTLCNKYSNGQKPVQTPRTTPTEPTPEALFAYLGKPTAQYDYTDEGGAALYKSLRFPMPGGDKTFRQCRPGGAGWIGNVDGVRLVLYHLSEVIEAIKAGNAVYLCEGEKDVERLRAWGLCATCNPMGAGKWEVAYTLMLMGANVVLLPDNDTSGREHMQKAAAALHGKAKRIKVVELPGLPEKGDVSDWMDAGGTKATLLEMVKATPDWTPPADSTPADRDEPQSAPDEGEKPKKSIAQQLIEIGSACDLFQSERGEGFAVVPVHNHHEVHPLRSKAFKGWLHRAYYMQTGRSANAQAMQESLQVLEAKCLYDSPTIPVGLRVAPLGDAVWLDLGDDQWRAACITADGWDVVNTPPTLFRRYAPTAAQVTPTRGGSVEMLRRFVNVRDDNAWRQLVAWLVAAFIPGMPHSVLVVHGEQGSAKSTLMRLLAMLIDPSLVPLRSEPRDIGEWVQAADHAWMITLDNVSHLPGWLSDAICRAVTGEGFSKRQLYTDGEDIILSFQRVVALTGIEIVAQRSDLLDRSLLLPLTPITPGTRRVEKEVLADFEAVRPQIVGALLSTLAGVLRVLPDVHLEYMPRMADFARVGVAVERVLGWPNGAFMAAYEGNIKEQHEEALSSSLVGNAVRKLMEGRHEWEGSATQLLQTLASVADVDTSKRRQDWPSSAKALSGQVKRLSPNLRAVGIGVDTATPHGKRLIILTRQGTEKSVPCVPCVSPLSEETETGTQTPSFETQAERKIEKRNARNDETPPVSVSASDLRMFRRGMYAPDDEGLFIFEGMGLIAREVRAVTGDRDDDIRAFITSQRAKGTHYA